MVKTKTALLVSIISSLIIGAIYYVSTKFIFNNPALMMSNITMVGVITAISTFLIALIGMKWRDWSKKW